MTNCRELRFQGVLGGEIHSVIPPAEGINSLLLESGIGRKA
jgi:hypothetical protein